MRSEAHIGWYFGDQKSASIVDAFFQEQSVNIEVIFDANI